MSTLRDKTEAPIVVYPKPATAPKKPWSWRRLLRHRAYQKRAVLCEALRSGRYRQSVGPRDLDGGMCALWLAVHLGISESWTTTWSRLGLDPAHGNMIIYMNDSARRSFPEIADYIESLP